MSQLDLNLGSFRLYRSQRKSFSSFQTYPYLIKYKITINFNTRGIFFGGFNSYFDFPEFLEYELVKWEILRNEIFKGTVSCFNFNELFYSNKVFFAFKKLLFTYLYFKIFS